MNVTDKWMLEQMQQMAASMTATLPQTSQNAEAPKTEKGESFQDMMDKAKAGDPSKQESAPSEKTEDTQVQETAPQTTQKTEKVPVTKNGDGSKTAELTAEQAALVAAGYAQLFFQEDGSAITVVCIDEEGNLVPPLAALGDNAHFYSGGEDVLVNQAGDDWVMEPTPELVEALEQLFRKTGDPRSVDDILARLGQKLQDPQAQTRVEIKAPEVPENPELPEVKETVERSVKLVDSVEVKDDHRDDTDSGLEAEVMTAGQPLFQDVKAAPVKVGENFQLDTTEPEMDDKLADTIRAAAQEGLREIVIKLSPENLGALTIKLTQSADGALQVVMHTANAKAANLLSQHLDGLHHALQNYGGQSQEVRVEVQRNEDSQQAGQQQQQQTDPDGRGQHSHQQQERHKQDNGHSGDFMQKLRLGLFGPEEN